MADRIVVKQTPEYRSWRVGLRDHKAGLAIDRRLLRLRLGLLGDVKSVGDRVIELRVNTGPGYRVYFTQRGAELVILLCGGDKSSQSRDIERAKALAERET